MIHFYIVMPLITIENFCNCSCCKFAIPKLIFLKPIFLKEMYRIQALLVSTLAVLVRSPRLNKMMLSVVKRCWLLTDWGAQYTAWFGLTQITY